MPQFSWWVFMYQLRPKVEEQMQQSKGFFYQSGSAKPGYLRRTRQQSCSQHLISLFLSHLSDNTVPKWLNQGMMGEKDVIFSGVVSRLSQQLLSIMWSSTDLMRHEEQNSFDFNLCWNWFSTRNIPFILRRERHTLTYVAFHLFLFLLKDFEVNFFRHSVMFLIICWDLCLFRVKWKKGSYLLWP